MPTIEINRNGIVKRQARCPNHGPMVVSYYEVSDTGAVYVGAAAVWVCPHPDCSRWAKLKQVLTAVR